MVVEVSPWTRATTLGRCSRIACSTAAGVNTVPHSACRVTTSAPTRSEISFKRWPKRPKIGTSTRSPGQISEVSSASIPERAVPLTSRAQWFSVRNTWRSRSMTWFM
jgi:hypothetical protein